MSSEQRKDSDSQQSASSGRHTNFPAASPESNVNPPGAPQSSHGSATEPVAAGPEGVARAGQGRQSGTPGARQAGSVVTPEDAAATADRGTSRRDG